MSASCGQQPACGRARVASDRLLEEQQANRGLDRRERVVDCKGTVGVAHLNRSSNAFFALLGASGLRLRMRLTLHRNARRKQLAGIARILR